MTDRVEFRPSGVLLSRRTKIELQNLAEKHGLERKVVYGAAMENGIEGLDERLAARD
jgi:hypothetical protein